MRNYHYYFAYCVSDPVKNEYTASLLKSSLIILNTVYIWPHCKLDGNYLDFIFDIAK